ncbi:MAG TPA: hypothetical protein VMY40_15595 [Anaerolineae bacterium]|nr:hypothetical protein [Anaerolineae bacterium]
MGCNILFRSDVRAVLIGVAVAYVSAAAADPCGDLGYIRGCLDTARAVALCHGLAWADMVQAIREALTPGAVELLEAARVGLLEE